METAENTEAAERGPEIPAVHAPYPMGPTATAVEGRTTVSAPGTGWRKFALACTASIFSMILCLHSNLTGAQWVEIQIAILSLYGGSNIVDKRLGGLG